MPPPVQSGCALLFDRLATPDPWEPAEAVPFRVLDGKALLRSVHRELQDLLNTRCTLRAAELETRRRTTLEYGLPDVTGMSPAYPADRAELAARVEAAILAWEPRIGDPRATVEAVPGRPRELRVHIEGMLRMHEHPAPVTFTVTVGGTAPVEGP
ncbi:MAG TPA: type VI secretion system baseplate subunit TssE [Longimicrobium sp.]|nr:type VI secretion system baseplate subunit TssE [Longimicrobium sp.]